MDLCISDELFKSIEEIYKTLPKKEKTFLEISGYPHYENVCSNILAFYINPNEVHELNNIVLEAIIDLSKEKDEKANLDISLDNIRVYREYVTEKGNRIDIVIQNEEIAIGIENKIMATVYNDLIDYSKTIEQLNTNKLMILLSLHDENDVATKNGFINITYSELFKKIRNKLDSYSFLDNKWYIYLLDFMKNLEEYEEEKNMETELNEWIKEHKNDIDKFNEIMNIAKKNISKKIENYSIVIENRIKDEKNVKIWNSENPEATAYITLNLGCNIDANLTAFGWKIGVFIWKKTNQTTIKQILSKNGFNIVEEENNHLWLYKFDYDYELEKIADIYLKVLKVFEKG